MKAVSTEALKNASCPVCGCHEKKVQLWVKQEVCAGCGYPVGDDWLDPNVQRPIEDKARTAETKIAVLSALVKNLDEKTARLMSYRNNVAGELQATIQERIELSRMQLDLAFSKLQDLEEDDHIEN